MKSNQSNQKRTLLLSLPSSSSSTIKRRPLTPPRSFPFPYLSGDNKLFIAFTITAALLLLFLPNSSSAYNEPDPEVYSSGPILYKLQNVDQDSATSGGGLPWSQLETSPKVSWNEVLKYYRDNGYVDFNPDAPYAGPDATAQNEEDRQKSLSDPAPATASGSQHHHHHQEPQHHHHSHQQSHGHGGKASSSVKGHANHHHHPKAGSNSALYNFLILAIPVIFVPVMALIWVALLASLANKSGASNPNKMFLSGRSGGSRLNKKKKF